MMATDHADTEAGMKASGGLLVALSDELAVAVERAGQAVVTVDGRAQGAASGIVLQAGEGALVVAAAHTLTRQEGITVTAEGGEPVPADLVGVDGGADVALLRPARPVGAPAPLVPAGGARVGHFVLALGRPSGGLVASFGVISVVGGRWRTARNGLLDGYVRADVSLLPGFSGGPLVDTAGRIVGFNSSHLAGGEPMAIPAHVLDAVVQRTLSGRAADARRGYLGVVSQLVELQSALRQRLGLEQTTGLMVLGVEPGGPAEIASFQPGDILLALAGKSIADAESLLLALEPDLVGRTIVAVVARGGARRELAVTPTARP